MRDNQDKNGREGVSQKWFHSKCAKISVAEIQLMKKNKGLKWMCEYCNGLCVHLIETTIKKIMNEGRWPWNRWYQENKSSSEEKKISQRNQIQGNIGLFLLK